MAPKASSNAPAQREETTGALATPVAQMLMEMAAHATMDNVNGTFTGDDLLGILGSETLEQMWESDEQGTYNAKMLSGCDLEIYSFEVKYSPSTDDEIKTIFVNPADGRKMYILVHAARINNSGEKRELRLPDIGENFTWNTSARFIVTKLWWLLKHGYFDPGKPAVKARIVGTELAGGRSVEKLKPITDVATINGQANEPPF